MHDFVSIKKTQRYIFFEWLPSDSSSFNKLRFIWVWHHKGRIRCTRKRRGWENSDIIESLTWSFKIPAWNFACLNTGRHLFILKTHKTCASWLHWSDILVIADNSNAQHNRISTSMRSKREREKCTCRRNCRCWDHRNSISK